MEAKLVILHRTADKKQFHACAKDGKLIRIGKWHRVSRADEQGFRYCTKCIGFFLSRYSFTFAIPMPTKREIAWKNRFDRAVGMGDRVSYPHGIKQDGMV